MDTLKSAGLNSTSIVLLPQWNYLMEHWRRWRPAAITAAVRTRERGALIERHRPIDLAVRVQVIAAAEAAFRVVLGVIGSVHQDRRVAEEVPFLVRHADPRATVTRAATLASAAQPSCTPRRISRASSWYNSLSTPFRIQLSLDVGARGHVLDLLQKRDETLNKLVSATTELSLGHSSSSSHQVSCGALCDSRKRRRLAAPGVVVPSDRRSGRHRCAGFLP